MSYNPSVIFGKSDYLISLLVVKVDEIKHPFSFEVYLKGEFIPFARFNGYYFIFNSKRDSIYKFNEKPRILNVERWKNDDGRFFVFSIFESKENQKHIYNCSDVCNPEEFNDALYEFFQDKRFNFSLLRNLFSSFEDYLKYLVGELNWEFRRIIYATIYSKEFFRETGKFHRGLREWLYSKEKLSNNAIESINSFVG